MFTGALIAATLSMQSGGVPPKLWQRFTTGVNITRWFCYEGVNGGPKHWDSYLNDQDLQNFRKLKVQFVRLCVSPDLAIRGDGSNPEIAPYIDKAIDQLAKAGIATVLDLHDNGQLKLDQPGARTEEFRNLWRAWAGRYKGKRYDELAFELVNEPVFREKPADWYTLQESLVKEIRSVDPKRTIVVSGTSWSGVDDLVKMKPLPQGNLIYTFHNYDPFFFTHQGATWAGEEAKHVKDMPFPSSPDGVAPLVSRAEDRYKGLIRDFGNQRFDAAYLERRIKLAADWAKANGVPLFLGEFGVYPPVSPVDARGRWFVAMRAALDKHNMPNCIWGYDDGFGLGRKLSADGNVVLDELTLKHFYRQP